MKSLKTLLFSATLSTAATAGLLFASNGHADAATNYTVVSGDTLSSISQKFAGNGSLIEKIANANKIANKNLIYVGETLTIDEETQTVTVAPATTQAATTTPVATQPNNTSDNNTCCYTTTCSKSSNTNTTRSTTSNNNASC